MNDEKKNIKNVSNETLISNSICVLISFLFQFIMQLMNQIVQTLRNGFPMIQSGGGLIFKFQVEKTTKSLREKICTQYTLHVIRIQY